MLAAHARARRALPMLALILAPRHPTRGDALAEMLRGARPHGRAALEGRGRSAPTPTSISPTPSARWGSGTASPRSASSAAASSTSAGTTPSSRRCSAAPSSTARTCATSSTATGGWPTPTPRCWCAREAELAEALVATMAPDRAAEMAAAAWAACSEGAEVTDAVLAAIGDAARRQALMRAAALLGQPAGPAGLAARGCWRRSPGSGPAPTRRRLARGPRRARRRCR